MKKVVAMTLVLLLVLGGCISVVSEGSISATVNTRKDPLNLWNAPNGSTALTQIPKGTTITILEKSDEWSKAEYDGKSGYVKTQYLLFSSENTTNNDNILSQDNANAASSSDGEIIVIDGNVTYTLTERIVGSHPPEEGYTLEKVQTTATTVSISNYIDEYNIIFIQSDIFEDGCPNLEEITGSIELQAPNGSHGYITIDGVLFKISTDSTMELIKYPPQKKDEIYHIPQKTNRIWSHAFSNNLYIAEVVFPASTPMNFGSYAFENCSNLTTLTDLNIRSTFWERETIFEGTQVHLGIEYSVAGITADEKQALYNKAIADLESKLKNPESLQVNSAMWNIDEEEQRIFLKIDYSAMNGFGGYDRDTIYYVFDDRWDFGYKISPSAPAMMSLTGGWQY